MHRRARPVRRRKNTRGRDKGVISGHGRADIGALGRIPGRHAHVRFGSKADISVCPRHVRFTPESGHRNRRAYYLRRINSGSLAIFAAIRRAASFVSSLVAGSRLPRAYLLLFGFSVLPSFFAWVSSFGSFANGSNRTL